MVGAESYRQAPERLPSQGAAMGPPLGGGGELEEYPESHRLAHGAAMGPPLGGGGEETNAASVELAVVPGPVELD